jgi:hypothetical protein
MEQRLQLRLDLGVKIFEALPAMPNHRTTERAEGFVTDFDRPRNMEFDVWHIMSLENGAMFARLVPNRKAAFE